MARIDLFRQEASQLPRRVQQAYNCVEVGQWFWSLFPGDKVVLPRPEVVQGYADSVPQDFRFGVKVPNSITLTHHYKKKKSDPLTPKPLTPGSPRFAGYIRALTFSIYSNVLG